MKDKIIVIAGTTACGKTAASIKLAQKINGEIISADSMQVYKYMDIGTAKVTPTEAEGIKHWLVDEFDPDFPYSVAVFTKYAAKYIKDITARGKVPIIVGGTGFYIKALLFGADFSEENPTKYRDELYKLYQEQGCDALYKILLKYDPESCKKIHKNNIKRVIRAIEYCKQTGEKFSQHNIQENNKPPVYDHTLFILTDKRETMYKRIEKRIDIMVEQGLVDEVRNLLNMGYSKDLTSMQGLGYKEIVAYLEGNISLDEAIDLLKTSTRRFAKRQVTWFKNRADGIWLYASDYSSAAEIANKMYEIVRG